jgi:processive 1,2-diacylglycerol beta-glucosyltransferase
MPARVLIVTASVGEGHDLPARVLRDELEAEHPGWEVMIEDGLAWMGGLIRAVCGGAPRVVFYRFQWVWDPTYWLAARFPPSRWGSQRLLASAAAPGMLRLVHATRPDVIVSTFPQSTEVLARLRRRGRLGVPVCAVITDLSALRYWAARGVDLHLVTHPESVAEVRRIAGASARVQCVRGLTGREFFAPRDPDLARSALGLAPAGKLVLISGGGWGVGDAEGAVEVALGIGCVTHVVCLCGRNERLQARLQRRFAGNHRVRVEGFTDRMGDWLSAADALVHSTAGLTILEAHIRGCPAVSYGWGRGHLRLNNTAFRRSGLALVASSRVDLADALRRALRARKPADLTFAGLPSAASMVADLASDGRVAAEPGLDVGIRPGQGHRE